MPLSALPTRTGARIDSLTPLRRHASSSGSEISSPSRYLVRTSSSASAAASSSWSRRGRDLVGEVVGDRDLDLVRAVEPPGLAVDEVDVALERLGGADRDLERRDLVAEAGPQRVERGRRVGVLAVALVDEEAGGGPGRAAEPDGVLEAGLDAAGRGVHHEDRAVGRGEALDHVGDEVRVAGRVDQRDPGPVRLERPDREAQRLAPLLLLGLEVEVGRPVVDATEARDGAGLERGAVRRASSCRSQRGRPGRRSEGGGGRRSSSSSASSVLLLQQGGTSGASAGAGEGSGHDSPLYSGPRCQVTQNGPRSSARRASPTPSAAHCSPRSPARSAWRRARAAATLTPTTGCGSPSRRRARSTCRPTTSSGRSTRRPAAARPSSSRRSSTRATARVAWRSSSRPRPTIATGPRPRSARCSRSPAASWPDRARSPGSSRRAA